MNKNIAKLLCCFISLCSIYPAFSDEQKTLSQDAIREIKLENNAFTRGEPIPGWVEEVKIPETQLRDAVVIRLADTQYYVSGTRQAFVHRAILVNQSAALGQVGQIPLYFVPQYEKLRLHAVRIYRGKEVIDQTQTVNVRFLQRENSFESGLYSGTVVAALLLSDVRVGDTVEYIYSTEGANPVFGNKYLAMASWDQTEPIVVRRVALNYPSDRNIQWRMVGDFRNTSISPKITTLNGMRQLRFEEKNIKGIDAEPFVPSNYFPYRILQFSEFRNWNEVARWAVDLFPPSGPLPDELSKLVAHLRTLSSDEDKVAEALQWVQSEIRYFSLSIGESSHRPYPPQEVVQRRYGDCKDKAYLLVTILNELGIPAVPVLVSTESRNSIGKMLSAPDVFDHVVVQATVGSKKYYLDGTRLGQKSKLSKIGSNLGGTQFLLASADSSELSVIAPQETQEPERLNEKINLSEFGSTGTLEMERTWQGISAEAMRLYLAQLTPEQFSKFVASFYEKRYPGIELSVPPRINDNIEQNHLTVAAQFKIPNLAKESKEGWTIPYFPGNLQGIFNIPDNLKRNFPVAIPTHPYKGRYTLSLDWPESVSVMFDPGTQKISNNYFDTQVSQSFRGHHASVTVDFSTRAAEIPVKSLTTFLEDINKLNKTIGSSIFVSRSVIKSNGLFGFGRKSLRESMKKRLSAQIERNSKAISSGHLKDDDLAEAYCSRAGSLADMEKPADGLKDAEEAVRIAPSLASAWFCHGLLNFDNGNFAAAVSDYTKALGLGHDEFEVYYRRGHAKYFMGKLSEAAVDFEKAVESHHDNSDQVYASIWLVGILKQQGTPIPDKIQAIALNNPKGEWPRPALSMLLGTLSPEQMQEELNRKKGDDHDMSQAEALYYLGQYYLGQGKTDLAKDAFRKTLEKGITVYIEHIAAGFELRRLESSVNH